MLKKTVGAHKPIDLRVRHWSCAYALDSTVTAVERGGLDVAPARAVVERLSRPARSLAQLRPARWCVLVCAGIAPVLLVAGWAIGGAVQPSSYSPVRQTVSVLSGYGGTDRWIVTSAVYLVGGCYLVMAAGLSALPASARLGLLVAGLAGVGIAAFPEPAQGTTVRHTACTAIGGLAIAIWPALVGRRNRYSSMFLGLGVSVAVTTVFVALFGWFILEAWAGRAVGLAERVASSVQVCWPFVVAVALRSGRVGSANSVA
jgi:hypothetical protein